MAIPEFRRGRALLGFMNQLDAGNFLNGMCVLENQNELHAYQEKWARAAEFVTRLKPRFLSNVNHWELPKSESSYAKELSSRPIFKQVFGTNFALREVELEWVIGFQRHLDTEHCAELAAKMASDDAFMLKCCLPLEFQQNLQVTFDQSVPGVTFSSVSPKLQFAGLQITGLGGPEVTWGGQPVQQPGVVHPANLDSQGLVF